MSEIVEAHDQNIRPKQSLSEILRPPAVSDLSTKCRKWLQTIRLLPGSTRNGACR